MYQVAQIRLREAGRAVYFQIGNLKPKPGDYCIVEADRGIDYGQATSEPEQVPESSVEQPLRKVIRIATAEDMNQINRNKTRVKDAIDLCSKKIEEHKLDMKLIDAEYAFDRSRIVFYFTAEGRVDFRDLVKDLAGVFKTRIELKQIGDRDEAKLLGGLGPCGRMLCCAKFLKDFEPVTMRMAKDQNLPLNPTKISGLCGRLMCCLGYEHECYKEFLKEMPREGQSVKTPQGQGKVVSINALSRKVFVRFEDDRELEFDVKDITGFEKRKK